MKDLACLEFTPEQFDELCSLCRNDALFPKSWAAWTDLLLEALTAAINSGQKVPKPLRLDPSHFALWCARVEVVPCMDALRAYAIIHRSPLATAHYGVLALDSRPSDLGTGGQPPH